MIRQSYSLKRLALTDFVVDVPRACKKTTLVKALEEAGARTRRCPSAQARNEGNEGDRNADPKDETTRARTNRRREKIQRDQVGAKAGSTRSQGRHKRFRSIQADGAEDEKVRDDEEGTGKAEKAGCVGPHPLTVGSVTCKQNPSARGNVALCCKTKLRNATIARTTKACKDAPTTPLVPLARNDAGTNASCSRLLVGSVRWTDRQSGRQALDGAETRRFLSHGGAAHGGSLPVSSMGFGLSPSGLPRRTPPPPEAWKMPKSGSFPGCCHCPTPWDHHRLLLSSNAGVPSICIVHPDQVEAQTMPPPAPLHSSDLGGTTPSVGFGCALRVGKRWPSPNRDGPRPDARQ